MVLSNGFAVGCLITIILHLLLPDEHDPDDADDVIRSPEGHGSFTTHANRTPAAFYNNAAKNGEDGSAMKPVEMAHMGRDDDTAHPMNSQV